MPDHQTIYNLLGLTVVGAPALLVTALGLPAFFQVTLSERTIARLVQTAMITGLVCSLAILALMLIWGERTILISIGDWVHITNFHFSIKFLFDRLSVPFAILSFALCGTIGAFGFRYMHRETGYYRFFILYSIFALGMVVASLAGTIETLFTGWELVGLSSALLVGFYHDRPSPVRNGLRVWIVYRISDAALLTASVALHHMYGQGDFGQLLGFVSSDPTLGWPNGVCHITSSQAMIVGLLLLFAAMGKSALVPFSGWLPRAMEGPTPSSAVFYGALSVHLGAFLLLRVSPVLDTSITLSGIVVVIGVVSAIYASFAGRVQTDIKSALAFASLTQVGIIVAEIGLGFRYIALIHILGHACFRTLQFVRAPTILHDYSTLENAIGNRLPRLASGESSFLPVSQPWLYLFAMEKGYLDAILQDYIVYPFLQIFRVCDSWERGWTDFLSGTTSRESDAIRPVAGAMEDLL